MGVLHPRGPAATGVAVLLAALCISHVSGATDPWLLPARLPAGETQNWEGDVDTVILDNSNFTQSIQSRKQFAADYAKAATELKKEGVEIADESTAAGLVLAKVNLDKPENHPLAQQFQVSGFPTIRIFKRMYDSDKKNPLGTMEAYDVEPRTKEGVLQQMRVLGLPPKRLKTAEDVAKAVADDVENSESRVSVLVVGVFADKKGPAYLAFKEAWFGRSTPRYVWVKAKDRALVAQYIGDAAGDVVAVITKFDDVPSGAVQILPASAMEDVDQIVRFVDIHSAPLVWRYNDALSSRVTTGKLQKFLWAFVDQKSEHWATYEKAATEVAVAERGKMKVVLVAETNLGVLNYFKIDPASLPQVVSLLNPLLPMPDGRS
ncbi:hypothetical protein T484DRAFT_1767769 [Baffinella frigidus]|nr:hypothetical protein T484DRAFT_1767769 [Cryptophyta sp. CCMP2293]